MTQADVFACWGGRDHIMELDLAIGDNDTVDTVNQPLHHLTAQDKGGVRETLAHALAERLNRAHESS
jgi:hypothetical protein